MDKDLIRLHHMLDSRSREELDTDRQLLFALTRELEILGEAANSISKNTQERISQIPWRTLIGMRNRLIHAYFDVNRNIIWNTAEKVLPDFRLVLERVIQDFTR
ncbi:MAG: HepT-like ribonuclease domain-containing protein [Chlamydiota bacterium]